MKNKITFKPGTMLNPLPVVMVSCGDSIEEYNIITIAWTGIINSEPPITYVSIRKSRHSHEIISKTKEFVINLSTSKLSETVDYCGVKSGRDINKFKERGLTPISGQYVKCPMIDESPVNIECRVREIVSYPSHDMFVADILAVHGDEDLLNEKDRFELEKADLICYSHGEYYSLKNTALGRFGYSIMKTKTKKRLEGNKGKVKKKRY